MNEREAHRKKSLGELCDICDSQGCVVCLRKQLDRAKAVIALQSTILGAAITEAAYKELETP